jgi:hypothetical protein
MPAATGCGASSTFPRQALAYPPLGVESSGHQKHKRGVRVAGQSRSRLRSGSVPYPSLRSGGHAALQIRVPELIDGTGAAQYPELMGVGQESLKGPGEPALER